ncbi:MAG TPA: nuclear transport factor 2 family protein [Acidimicrobiia bacterium]|nr:nuclear transport factor 2 family protein [Acidimicrobiia bacterium]
MIIAEPTPAQASDVIAINQLAASYADAVSRLQIEEAVDTYAVDGVLASPTTEDAVGRPAIVEVISAATASLEFVFQTVHSGLVQVDGDRASARFPVTEWSRRKRDGVTMLFLGLYEDDLVRTPDGWRFERRELVARTLGKAALFTGRIHDPMLRPTLEPRMDAP